MVWRCKLVIGFHDHAIEMTAAARGTRDQFPRPIAAASSEFTRGPLVENPYRVGRRYEIDWKSGS